jgi:hypothetical protein
MDEDETAQELDQAITWNINMVRRSVMYLCAARCGMW